MFINFSNHPSEAWGKAQLNAAMEYGEVIDIPFRIQIRKKFIKFVKSMWQRL